MEAKKEINDDQKYILRFLKEIYHGSKTLNSLDAIKLLFVNETNDHFITHALKYLTQEQADEVAFLFANWVIEAHGARGGGCGMKDKLFSYEDTEFEAKNIDAATDKFSDDAWGDHYVEYLKKAGLGHTNIYVEEDIEAVEEDYRRVKHRLENGTIFQIEIWLNDDGTYTGYAEEVERERAE